MIKFMRSKLETQSRLKVTFSTRTVKALAEVEAFALEAEELKFVASQFRRLHSRQVEQTFRLYSQQWRTWASSFIQAAWRRHSRRKNAELRRIEEEEDEMGYEDEYDDDDAEEEDERTPVFTRTESSSRLRSTIFASRFAANALKGHRLRSTESSKRLLNLQKPPEPDFDAE